MSTPSQSTSAQHQGALLEEERLPWYDPKHWYPVQTGEIFQSRYQVLLKLHFSSASTVWLCRDLKLKRYVSIEILAVGSQQALNETRILSHLASIRSDHPGASLVVRMIDTFDIRGEVSLHTCIVQEALALSLATVRDLAGGRLDADVLKPILYGILLALEFLHSSAGVVHSDICAQNIQFAIPDQEAYWNSFLRPEEANRRPTRGSQGRPTYSSVEVDLPVDPGQPVICGFRHASLAKSNVEAMPSRSNAPEDLLGGSRDPKIDIWSFGVMVWEIVQGESLFREAMTARGTDKAAQIAIMVALMGSPPKDLRKSPEHWGTYFDKQGNLESTNRRYTTSLENEDRIFQGREKALFLDFMRKTLRWRPEERSSAAELLRHPWLGCMDD